MVQILAGPFFGLLIAARTASSKSASKFSSVLADTSMNVPIFLLTFNPSLYDTCDVSR